MRNAFLCGLLFASLAVSGCSRQQGGSSGDKSAVVSPKNSKGGGSTKQPDQNTQPYSTPIDNTNPSATPPGQQGQTSPQPMGTDPLDNRTPTSSKTADAPPPGPPAAPSGSK